MRIGVKGDNVLEQLALASGLAPIALAESWITFHLARTIMVATKLGLFDVLAEGPATGSEIASRCGTDPHATERLLVSLAGSSYVTVKGERYTRASKAKLLASDHPESFRNKIIMQLLEWDWLSYLETFVRTGQPMDVHATMPPDDWPVYQRGMRSGIEPLAREVARRLRLPKNPELMLDIGGSHGFFSVCFCRRHPTLRAEILDLPEAIPHAEEVLAKDGMGDRVFHTAGDALEADLGEERYDLIFSAAFAHHLDADANLALAARCAKALKPGGVLATYDAFRIDPGRKVSQIGGIFDLFFSMTSAAGTWSPEEIAGWQRAAGLIPRKPLRLMIVRDIGVQAADKR